MNRIHPSLQELNIPNEAKMYFSSLEFDEIINDSVIYDPDNNTINESIKNCWSFKVDLKFCTKEDLIVFYNAIINNRRNYLLKQNIKTKFIFYTWYDSLSGNFYFSLISIGSNKLPQDTLLPFKTSTNSVEFLDNIVDEFVNDPYKGVIPFNELKSCPFEDDDAPPNKPPLNVWSIVIP